MQSLQGETLEVSDSRGEQWITFYDILLILSLPYINNIYPILVILFCCSYRTILCGKKSCKYISCCLIHLANIPFTVFVYFHICPRGSLTPCYVFIIAIQS